MSYIFIETKGNYFTFSNVSKKPNDALDTLRIIHKVLTENLTYNGSDESYKSLSEGGLKQLLIDRALEICRGFDRKANRVCRFCQWLFRISTKKARIETLWLSIYNTFSHQGRSTHIASRGAKSISFVPVAPICIKEITSYLSVMDLTSLISVSQSAYMHSYAQIVKVGTFLGYRDRHGEDVHSYLKKIFIKTRNLWREDAIPRRFVTYKSFNWHEMSPLNFSGSRLDSEATLRKFGSLRLTSSEIFALYSREDSASLSSYLLKITKEGTIASDREVRQDGRLGLTAQRGDLCGVELLIAHGSDPLFVPPGLGGPVHFAATNPHSLNILALLLGQYNANVNHRGYQGNTPLIIAASRNLLSTVEALLFFGARPDIVDDQENSALIYAASRGFSDMVDLLLRKGADINYRGFGGNTALMALLKLSSEPKGYEQTIDTLLRFHPDLSIKNSESQTALTIAYNSDRDVYKRLSAIQHR